LVLQNLSEDNPFNPFVVFKDGRSADVGDLGTDDIKQIENALTFTKQPLIIGFLNDVLGLVKKDNACKLIAANHLSNTQEAYCQTMNILACCCIRLKEHSPCLSH
jgi:hypothetical protein